MLPYTEMTRDELMIAYETICDLMNEVPDGSWQSEEYLAELHLVHHYMKELSA